MEDHIVIDVEIQKTIEETPGGWDATDKLGVAVAVVYEHNSDRFRVYGHTREELLELRDRLSQATRISGFNIWRFDFPVIYGEAQPWRAEHLRGKTNDILARIWRALNLDEENFSKLHGGWGLDVVARGTLGGPGKIANGAQAPKWFQAGEFGRVANYCLDDVTLERDLAAFVDRHGYVVNGKTGQVLRLDR